MSKSKIFKIKIFLLVILAFIVFVVSVKFLLLPIGYTNASFISVAPLSGNVGNANFDVVITVTDLNGNAINSSSIVLDTPFLLKIKNSGSVPFKYKVSTDGTQQNDITNYVVLYVDNKRTSTSTNVEIEYVAKNSLLAFKYIITNNNLRVNETDTYEIKFSKEILDNPIFQSRFTITSTEAVIALRLFVDQIQ